MLGKLRPVLIGDRDPVSLDQGQILARGVQPEVGVKLAAVGRCTVLARGEHHQVLTAAQGDLREHPLVQLFGVVGQGPAG